jgi:hypothetical protein
MTAITFPLKKFPGQFSHRSMVFTGRVSAHITILTMSALLHGLLILMLQVQRPLDALLYSLPMVGFVFFQMIYLVNVKLDDVDYFDMSLNELKGRYKKDGKYFDNVGVIGLFISVVSLFSASIKYVQDGSFSPLLAASNACLLSLIYQVSLHKGLYTKKRIAVYIFSAVIIEAFFIAASVSEMYVTSFAVLCASTAYLFNERSKGHSLYGLLQNIIK